MMFHTRQATNKPFVIDPPKRPRQITKSASQPASLMSSNGLQLHSFPDTRAHHTRAIQEFLSLNYYNISSQNRVTSKAFQFQLYLQAEPLLIYDIITISSSISQRRSLWDSGEAKRVSAPSLRQECWLTFNWSSLCVMPNKAAARNGNNDSISLALV